MHTCSLCMLCVSMYVLYLYVCLFVYIKRIEDRITQITKQYVNTFTRGTKYFNYSDRKSHFITSTNLKPEFACFLRVKKIAAK